MGRHPSKPNITPTPGRPDVPPNVQGEALAEWDRVTAELERMGNLYVADRAILAMYCRAWERWVKAEAMIDQIGLTIQAKRTKTHANNIFVSISRDAHAQVAALSKELGLTPRARTILAKNNAAGKVDGAEPTDDFSDLDEG